MIRITTNADQASDALARKTAALQPAVAGGVRSAILAVEAAAVKNLSGSNAAETYSYPVPARTGNLRSARSVSQPQPSIGILAFNSDYAWAVETGHVTQWAGRGKTREIDRASRPFAADAVKSAHPETYVLDAVRGALAV